MALLTAIDIVNAACMKIGEEPIESFDADTLVSQAASLIYEGTVDFNLGLQPSGFAFAREVRQLSRLTGAAPLSGWSYVFEIPGEKIGLPVFVSDDASDPERSFSRYSINGGKIHSDAEALVACVKFRPDPHLWTATFRMATITAIAGDLAMAIASDKNTRDAMHEKAYGTSMEGFRGGMMRTALSEDGFANPPRKINLANNPLERAWRGG